MKEQLHYNWRDIFNSAKIGFSMKKIIVAMKGIFISLFIYSFLTYIALLFDGATLQEIWSVHHFLPLAIVNNWFANVLLIIGFVILIAGLLLTATAVSRITLKELQGDIFYEGEQGIKFALKNWKNILLTPVGLLLFIIFLLFCAFIVGLIGRIPYAGELLTSPFTIFYFAAAFLVVFTGFVWLLAFILIPIIVATTEGDFFDGIFYSFSVVIKEFWRFLLYRCITKFMAFVGTTILIIASLLSFGVIKSFCGLGMGQKLMDIGGVALKYLPIKVMEFFAGIHPDINIWGKLYHEIIMPVYWGSRHTDLNWSGDISAFLVGISINIILLFIVSYLFSVFAVGDTLMFIALKKKMDGDDLLEVPEEDDDDDDEIAETDTKEEVNSEEPAQQNEE